MLRAEMIFVPTAGRMPTALMAGYRKSGSRHAPPVRDQRGARPVVFQMISYSIPVVRYSVCERCSGCQSPDLRYPAMRAVGNHCIAGDHTSHTPTIEKTNPTITP
jgi:hypothetical protein